MYAARAWSVCMYSLSNLESLELRENLIKYLPASLSCLVKLKTLDLGSNLIDELVIITSCYSNATMRLHRLLPHRQAGNYYKLLQ